MHRFLQGYCRRGRSTWILEGFLTRQYPAHAYTSCTCVYVCSCKWLTETGESEGSSVPSLAPSSADYSGASWGQIGKNISEYFNHFNSCYKIINSFPEVPIHTLSRGFTLAIITHYRKRKKKKKKNFTEFPRANTDNLKSTKSPTTFVCLINLKQHHIPV